MKLPYALMTSLVGSKLWILRSKDRTLEGISGRICQETRNTFKIKSSGKKVEVVKRACDFIIEVDGNNWLVKGKSLENREIK